MEPERWLRDEVDERLEGLFSEEPELLQKTMQDLMHEALADPEIEEILVETLERGLAQGNDETMGLAWISIVLGEIGSSEAVAPLRQILVSGDEDLISAATRALRRIGEPAFEAVLELIEDEDVATDCYVAAVRVLEGIALHEQRDLRDRIEETLYGHVRTLTRRLVGADVDPLGEFRRDGIRQLEAAALALARLGVERAGEAIAQANEIVCDQSNSFLREALEIIEEAPEGLPCSSDSDWQVEFRWAFGSALPGGEIELPKEERGEETTAEESPRRF